MRPIFYSIVIFLFSAAFSTARADWASETLASMTVDQKIGQLFIGGVYPTQESAASEGRSAETVVYEEKLVRNLRVGGVLLKHSWQAAQQCQRLKELQELAGDVPLFVAQDLERGLGARIHDALAFPKNMTLGAIQDNSLLYRMGLVVGAHARHVGTNLILAPVVDINTNSSNPVIHMRSFGEEPERVTAKGLAVMKGIQDAGALACAKHFPGHGDTSRDSHEDLPHLMLERARLDTVELVPFRELIVGGVSTVLTAHLTVPALDATKTPASLSAPVVTGLLRRQLGFDGLIITDDLAMGAIQQHYGAGLACKMAFLAGSDLILTTNGVEEGIEALLQAFRTGEIAEQDLDKRVVRILRAKQYLVQQDAPSVGESPEALQKELYRRAITLLGNRSALVRAREYTVVEVSGESADSECEIPPFAKGVLAFFAPSDTCTRAGFLASAPSSAEALQTYWRQSHTLADACHQKRIPLVVVWLGSPYGLRGVVDADAILVAYEDAPAAREAVWDVVRGDQPLRGRLPVTVNQRYPAGAGVMSDE